MKEVVKEMLAHPIASLVVIGAIGSAVADVARAVKGNPKGPVIGLTIGEETAKRILAKSKERPLQNYYEHWRQNREKVEEVKEEQTKS